MNQWGEKRARQYPALLQAKVIMKALRRCCGANGATDSGDDGTEEADVLLPMSTSLRRAYECSDGKVMVVKTSRRC